MVKTQVRFSCVLIWIEFSNSTSARRHAFLLYVEHASHGYSGLGFYLILNFYSPDCLHDILFYVELASPGYLGFGFYLILNFLSPARRRGFFYFYVELACPGYLGFRGYLSITCFLQPVCEPSFLTWNSHQRVI